MVLKKKIARRGRRWPWGAKSLALPLAIYFYGATSWVGSIFESIAKSGQVDHITASHSNSYLSRLAAHPLRRKALDPTKKFSFVHISKCAGTSWLRLMKKILRDTCPRRESGQEHPVWYQNHTACPRSDYHLTSLRSPRHHVWSMFAHTKWWHGVNGVLRRNHPGFPSTGESMENHEADFRSWVVHFLDPFEADDRFGFYHPANFQARYLTAKETIDDKGHHWAHGVEVLPEEYQFEPDLELAMATYWKFDFVALAEFFHESRCLFYYRLGMDREDAHANATLYLNDKCRCPRPDDGDKDIHVAHHDVGKRSILRDLPESTLSKVDRLTRIDVQIYVMALRQFMDEVAWLESEHALGRRVLCDESLERMRGELAYLAGGQLNVTDMYRSGQ